MPSLSIILGIIGNVISILMFLSPVKTFKTILKKKSTENYKGIPYITTLLSTCLWTFYGMLKPGGLLIVTVNGAGAALHIIYVALFLIYAPRDVKVKSMKLVGILDVGFLGVVICVTLVAIHGSLRLTLVGLLCAALTVGMYAAPLAAMKTVIKTKSVEYMPFSLSFFQFLNGGVWAAYSLLIKDFYILVPNGIGFVLGSAQILLYVVYKNKSPSSKSSAEDKEEEGSAHLVKKNLEMLDFHGKQVKQNHGLSKGNSLPKPAVNRQYSQKIMRTASLWPDELSSLNARDVELGLQGNH